MLALSACQPAASPVSATNLQPTTAAPTVRACDFVPGKSVPAQIPASSAQLPTNLTSITKTFTNTTVDSATLAKQMDLYYRIDADITNHYVYANFNGKNWKAISLKYKDLIQKGLNQADFYLAITQMVGELDDGQSFFLSPGGHPNLTAAAPSSEFAGIGTLTYAIHDQGQAINVLRWVFPGSPAEKAGVKPHDVLLKVDGRPITDANGDSSLLGPSGSSVTVTVGSPGQNPRDVKMVRNKISQSGLVDYCLAPGTRIGYMRWEQISDPSVLDQTVDALNALSGDSPLEGLVIDKRLNEGSDTTVLQSLLSFFVGGTLGSFVSTRSVNPATPEPFTANPVTDVSGSLNLPLVVIQDQTTGDAALFGGLLQLIGRAKIVGQPANGGAFTQYIDDFSDGSTLVLASMTFQPNGKTPGYWDKTGVIPDVSVSGRWDQFNEANDPYLAKAIELLTKK